MDFLPAALELPQNFQKSVLYSNKKPQHKQDIVICNPHFNMKILNVPSIQKYLMIKVFTLNWVKSCKQLRETLAKGRWGRLSHEDIRQRWKGPSLRDHNSKYLDLSLKAMTRSLFRKITQGNMNTGLGKWEAEEMEKKKSKDQKKEPPKTSPSVKT